MSRSGEKGGDGVDAMPASKPTQTNVPAGEGAGTIQTVNATLLLGERRMLRIEHHGEVYTLRITKNERLILTK